MAALRCPFAERLLLLAHLPGDPGHQRQGHGQWILERLEAQGLLVVAALVVARPKGRASISRWKRPKSLKDGSC